MKKQTVNILAGGIFSLVIAMGIGRFAYTPILPLMQKDLSFSNAIAGWLATSNYAGYLLGAILARAAVFNRHRIFSLRISLIISILTTAFMGLTQQYFYWTFLRFLSGMASAFVFVLASSIVLDRLGASGRTNWSGVFYGGVGFGIFLTSMFIPGLNQRYRWEGAWLGLAFLGIIFLIFIWSGLKHSDAGMGQKNSAAVLMAVPPSKWLPWLIAAYGLEGLGYIVTGTFIVSIAAKAPSFSGDSNLVWMAVGAAAVPSCIIWSFLAKQWGFVRSLVAAMILQSFGIMLPVFSMSEPGLIASALLFGATFMGITTLATTLARQINPDNSNQIIGILTGIFAVGQMIGPAIAGVLASFTHDYNAALIGASGIVLIGAILLLNGIKYEKKSEIAALIFYDKAKGD